MTANRAWRSIQFMHCHACNAELLLSGGERVGFGEACERCRADVHVCLNCTHHDPSSYNECRESSAERVSDPERANRCEYFRPTERAGGSGAGASAAALRDLEAIFKK